MKYFRLILLFILAAFAANAQAIRFDPQPTQTVSTNAPSGSYPQVLAIPGATIHVCNSPSNAGASQPCTNYATTYTDITATVACSTSTQLTLAATSSCVGTSDGQGSWGFWALPGTYTYTITLGNGSTYGPYTVTTVQSATQINFQNAGTGAVQRTSSAKESDIVSVKDFGAKGDGTTDDTTAIQNAINSLSVSGSVLFPAGTYKVTSAITLKTGVSLSGYGATIYPATANMTLFNLSYGSATSANLTIAGFVIDPQGLTGVTGISFTFVKDATVRDIFFRAVAKTVAVDRAGNGITIDKCTSSGNLAAGKAGQLLLWSSVDTDYVNYVNVDHYTVFNTGTGVVNPAIYVRRGVAVHISHVGANDMHVGGDATGVLIENDCQGVRVTDSIFGSGSTAITIQTGTGVNVAPSFITVTSVDSDQMTLAGFYVINGNWVSFSNGKITSSGATPSAAGILLQNAAGQYFQISEMQINGFNGTGGSGIAFSGITQLEISNNKISSCSTPIGANGTNTSVRIHDNEFSNYTSGNPITGTMTGSGNWVYHNLPAQSATTVTPTMPASNSPITNTTGYTVRYSISGGTFSQILSDGTAMGTGATFGYLDPGETITITYTVAPTWVWLIEP